MKHHPSVSFDDGVEVHLDWNLLATLDDEFVQNTLRRGERTESLPEKDLARLALSQMMAPKRPEYTECPEGDCIEITGRVAMVKDPDRESIGESWKILVQGEAPNGSFRVWGRVSPSIAEALGPRGQRLARLEDHIDVRGLGLQVRLAAKVTRSQRDESFGLLGRIKHMEIVPQGTGRHAKPIPMPVETAQALRPGDQVFRWWDQDEARPPTPLKVVSVNRKTLTVESRSGRRWRVPLEELGGTITSPHYA
jgi:hypothetical protein